MTRALLLAAAFACVGCATDDGGASDHEHLVTQTTKRVYFGVNEVRAGRLKSATGDLPAPGDIVTLQVDLDLAQFFLCHGSSYDLPLGAGFQACRGIDPQLFVRFRGDTPFVQVVDGVPAAGWVPQHAPYGTPIVRYPDQQAPATFDIELEIPSDATRIEVYERTGRVNARCRHDHTFEQRECFSVERIDDGYISNYGANFQIAVE